MLNAIPVFGWILSFVFAVSMAVPFWVAWTACGIGEKYFYFLPEVYWHIGFWESVGLFTVLWILKSTFYPRLSVSQDVDSKGK